MSDVQSISPAKQPGMDQREQGSTMMQQTLQQSQAALSEAKRNADDLPEEEKLEDSPNIEEPAEENGPLTKKQQLASYLIFKLDVRLFKFRGDSIPKGQYKFPFTFKVPKKNVPSSFKFINDKGECYCVKYTIEVYFKDGLPLMSQTKEFRILAAQKQPRRVFEVTPAKVKPAKKFLFNEKQN